MGGSPSVSSTPAPPSPEPVKRVESEVTQARNDARAAAAKRYGVSGTNITRGTLTGGTAETKKRTLGGA